MVKIILPLLLATSAMGMPVGDELAAAPRPAKPDFNPAQHIRKWLRDGKIINVNSLDDGSLPVSSLEFSLSSDRQCDGFQFENKGNPIILLSKSGLTYKNWVNHGGDVTLTADKFGHGRVLLYGSLKDLDLSAGNNTEEALQKCFVSTHPEAEGIFDGEGAEDLVWLEFDVDHLNCAGTVNGVTYDEDIDRENFHGDFDLGPEDSDDEDEGHHGKHHGKKHHGKKHHGKKHHGKKHHGKKHHGDHHDEPHHDDHHDEPHHGDHNDKPQHGPHHGDHHDKPHHGDHHEKPHHDDHHDEPHHGPHHGDHHDEPKLPIPGFEDDNDGSAYQDIIQSIYHWIMRGGNN